MKNTPHGLHIMSAELLQLPPKHTSSIWRF